MRTLSELSEKVFNTMQRHNSNDDIGKTLFHIQLLITILLIDPSDASTIKEILEHTRNQLDQKADPLIFLEMLYHSEQNESDIVEELTKMLREEKNPTNISNINIVINKKINEMEKK